jgi:DNA-binding CsgD family transcriptional regulator
VTALNNVIGRTVELAAIDEFLDSLADGPAALVLEGDPGIGKTTLVRAAIETARGRNVHVLSCAASESDPRLSYGALGELLARIDRDVVGALPPPQRDALDAALIHGGSGPPDAEPRAVATAVLSVLEQLARSRPVMVAIDGLQWLDRPSARVVEFCTRRLRGPVGLMASRHSGAGHLGPPGELRLRHPERMDVRRLAPLDARALRHVMRQRADRPLALHALERVNEASGGNLFYALELARALPAEGPAPPALLLPPRLQEIVESRLAGLDGEVEELLLAVAALTEPTVELLTRALGAGTGVLLDEAEEHGLVEYDGHRVRFPHPLLAIGIQARASLAGLCRMHRRLSAVVSDVEERARHLAYAQVMPEAVPALDQAARHLRARGAPAAAAELLELARGLGGATKLQVRAAEHHFDAGDSERARELLDKAIATLPGGGARAEALLLLAEIRYSDGRLDEARTLLEEARAQHEVDERLLVKIDLLLAYVLCSLESVPAARIPARAALVRADELDDDALLAQALALSACVDFTLGLQVDDQLDRALQLERAEVRTTSVLRPSRMAALVYLRTGRLDEARRLLTALCDGHAERGEDHDLAWACLSLVWLECWRGDIAAATHAVDEAVERLLQLETCNGRALGLAARAQLDAYAGRAHDARRAAHEALALFDESDWQSGSWRPLATLAFLDLSLGDPEAAAARFTADSLAGTFTGLGAPGPWDRALLRGDAAEALIAVGRLDEADTVVALLERQGSALGRALPRGVASRCRGLLLAARGDLAGAEEALQHAVDAHEQLPILLERARGLLLLGRIQRRRRRRGEARATLERALALFDAVGSPLWADRAREELETIDPDGHEATRLTAAEERVARLAASGLTNREVAATVYVSPKTVEVHLSRAYRKLGIRSRAELGARMTIEAGTVTGQAA